MWITWLLTICLVFNRTSSGNWRHWKIQHHISSLVAETVLHRCLLQCRYFGVAPSARQTYQSGLNAFIMFCSQFDITSFPASSLTLEYFCAHASQYISYKTLKVYLSSNRLAHIEQGLPDPTKSVTVHSVCRGIRHQQGDKQRTGLPIIINLLWTLKEQLQLLYHFGTAYAVNSIHCCILQIFQS